MIWRRTDMNSKDKNIAEVAHELNVSLDSIVFFDDNPVERELIKKMLPDVTVPDFPEEIEKLPIAIIDIFQRYFDKPVVTRDDIRKTVEYRDNVKRNDFKRNAGSYEDYLKGLSINILHYFRL